MTKKEKEYWDKFREKYGNKFKRVSVMTSSGVYVEVDVNDVAMFEKADRAFLVGDMAEYIYDLEDIKEESLVMFKKYNKLLEKYNKLKGEQSEDR
jgi:hypothetical protein